jgi:adenylate kinase
VHLSTGDVFRYNIKNGTELGKLAQSFINQGKLVPDEVTISMLKAEVEKRPDAKGFIFDGFPRTTAQAEALDAFLNERYDSIEAMVALEVPEDELKSRLLARAETSGRADDDNPEVIQNRIDVYNAETAPVADFYKGAGKYKAIDGLGSIEEITERLVEVIDA